MVLKRPTKHYVEISLDQFLDGLAVQFICRILESVQDGKNIALKVTDGHGEVELLVQDFAGSLPVDSIIQVFAHVKDEEFQVVHIIPLEKFDFVTYASYVHKKL